MTPSTLQPFNPSPAAAARFEVGCEGELLDSFPTAAEALHAARAWCELTACPHEIFDAATRLGRHRPEWTWMKIENR